MDSAEEEFFNFEKEVQRKFYKLIKSIEDENLVLSSTLFKRLNNTLFELRIKHDTNIFRGIGSIYNSNLVIVLFYQKKSQKMPINYLQLAYKRFNSYKINNP